MFLKAFLFKSTQGSKILLSLIILVLTSCGGDLLLSSSSPNSSIPFTSTNSETSEDAYLNWKNSNQAIDLNGDQVIDQADFAIWQQYLIWKDSDDAQDLNGDRRINVIDYLDWIAYSNWKSSVSAYDFNEDKTINYADYSIWKDYQVWKNSTNAVDLNDDQIINELDYEIYLQGNEFAGQYSISNYTYSGPELLLGTSRIRFSELGASLQQISLFVDQDGKITTSIPLELRNNLGEDLATIEAVFAQMTIQRLSPLLITLETVVSINNIAVNLTFYLETISGGYASSLEFTILGNLIDIAFNILKE